MLESDVDRLDEVLPWLDGRCVEEHWDVRISIREVVGNAASETTGVRPTIGDEQPIRHSSATHSGVVER